MTMLDQIEQCIATKTDLYQRDELRITFQMSSPLGSISSQVFELDGETAVLCSIVLDLSGPTVISTFNCINPTFALRRDLQNFSPMFWRF